MKLKKRYQNKITKIQEIHTDVETQSKLSSERLHDLKDHITLVDGKISALTDQLVPDRLNQFDAKTLETENKIEERLIVVENLIRKQVSRQSESVEESRRSYGDKNRKKSSEASR